MKPTGCDNNESSAPAMKAELAQRRYMSVDPSNRLVADTLEADWNQKLRALGGGPKTNVSASSKRSGRNRRTTAGSVLALSSDFQRVWGNPQTPDRERKTASCGSCWRT